MFSSMRHNSIGLFAGIVLAASVTSARGLLVTFDDVPDPGLGVTINNGYAGLDWSNFHFLDAITENTNFGPEGYINGMVSPTNVAVNSFGNPATISEGPGGGIGGGGTPGPFDLISGYFTSAWNDNLSVTADGYQGANLVYSTTFVVSTLTPTLETLNFLGVSSVTFTSSGGTPHGYTGSGEEFALDNLNVNVPEPMSLAVLGFGACGLLIRRRKVG